MGRSVALRPCRRTLRDACAARDARRGLYAPATNFFVFFTGSRSLAGSLYRTAVIRPSVISKEVSEARVHSRLRGSWKYERLSAARRLIQIGSWWLTRTTSWPGA